MYRYLGTFVRDTDQVELAEYTFHREWQEIVKMTLGSHLPWLAGLCY